MVSSGPGAARGGKEARQAAIATRMGEARWWQQQRREEARWKSTATISPSLATVSARERR